MSRVEVEIYDNQTYDPIDQTGSEPDRRGYFIRPPWLDFDQSNFQYSHKNSSRLPWRHFADCPFGDHHPPAYSANAHLDRHDPDDHATGEFNGMVVRPADLRSPQDDYELAVEFRDLVGVATAGDLCVVAHVETASGDLTRPARWNCSF